MAQPHLCGVAFDGGVGLQDAMSGEGACSRSTTPVSVRSPQQAKRPGVAASGAGHLSTSATKSNAAQSRPASAAGRAGTAPGRGKVAASKATGASAAESAAPLQATSTHIPVIICCIGSK